MTEQDLKEYYTNLYPYNLLELWLTYNHTVCLNKRELSYEHQGGGVQRYITFRNAKQMKQNMIQVIPKKVDAGPIYQFPPQKNQKNNQPLQRQFIFDFDMNDYDDVRNCCQGKKICSQCWKLLEIAMDLITTTLEQEFGFKKFMYVFSGGRGIHIWVCDQKAREMKDSTRKSIVDYLQLVTGNSKGSSLLAENVLPPMKQIFKKSPIDYKIKQLIVKQCIIPSLHPHVQRSLTFISKKFDQIFQEQKALQFQKGRLIVGKILASRCPQLKNRVFQKWTKCQNKTAKLYKILLQQVNLFQKTKTNQEYIKVITGKANASSEYIRTSFIEQQILLSFLYPRMDYNVSTMKNHLLKLPFSVHPTTTNISVPLFKHSLRDFIPQKALKLNDLIKNIKQLENDQKIKIHGVSNQEIAKQTLLVPYINAMQDFCNEMRGMEIQH